MRIAALLVSTAAALSCLTVAAPAFASAGPATPGVGVAPAHPQPGGVGYFVETARPGAALTDEALVANPGSAPVHVLVYPVDGLTATTSGAVYGDRTTRPHGAGEWVTTSASSLTLAPQSRRLVRFTVRVPADATPGDHLAGLAFENEAVNSRTAGALTVRTVDRSVVGILVRVAGPASTAVQVSGVRLAILPGFGTAAVNVHLANSGGLLVKPVLRLTVRGAAGYTRTVSRQLDTLLPADVIDYPLPWPDRLPAGAYTLTAQLSAHGMSPVTFTTTAQLGRQLNASVAGEKPTVAAAAHGGALRPVGVVAAALAVLAAGAGLTLRRRRRRSPSAPGRHAQGAGARHAHAGGEAPALAGGPVDGSR